MVTRKGKKGEWVSGKLEGSFGEFEKQLLLEDLDQKSVYRYRGCLLTYQKWLREKDMDPNPQTTKFFIADMRRQGYSSASQHLYYIALRKVLHFLGYEEQQTRVKLRQEHRLPPYYSSADMEAVLRACDGNFKLERTLFMCLCYAGLRVGEVLKLTVADVKLHLNRPMLVVHGKGRKDRNVPIHSQLGPVLAELVQGKKARDKVFPWNSQKSVWTIVHQMGERVGLDLHPHSLRHFFGTQLSEQRVPLRQIQELMGHQKIETTAIYIQVAPIDLTSAVESISINRDEASEVSKVEDIAAKFGVSPDLVRAIMELPKASSEPSLESLTMTAAIQVHARPAQN
ncbi:tyrosine-type recombinase/integrase [Chloroflexota bacterium]